MAPTKAIKYVIVLVACFGTGLSIDEEEAVGTTSVTTEEPATTVFSTTSLDEQGTTQEPKTDAPTTIQEERTTEGKPNMSSFVFEVEPQDGNLQDMDAEETKMFDNLFIQFEPKKYKDKTQEAQESVQITSYIADSDTAKPMNMKEFLPKRNKSGADMISAFFVAPDDEVNEIDKTKYSGRPIVVTDLREDLIRTERYSNKEDPKPLTNNILAPIQAAVSLSHKEEKPFDVDMTIEKQVLHEEPVYKTIIDVQKSIPYEIKEVEQKEPHNNEITPQIYQRPQRPVYYRYPMYYIPQSYIGNYIMRHSHENTGFRQIKPAIIPLQYYINPQVQQPHTQIYSGILLNPYYLDQSSDTTYEADQNGLQSENKIYQHKYQPQQLHQVHHLAPFRPSHPVFTSQYPPYTYRVLSTMRGRGARSAKQFYIEYGGFKPPMIPSVQIDEEQDPAQEKTVEETLENV